MKTIQITINVVVDDDVNPSDFSVFNHDVCDGVEVLLPIVFNDNGDQRFRIAEFNITNTKEV